MRFIRFIPCLIFCLLLSCCAQHFQIFQTQSEQLALDEESLMRFHGDENLDVYYDLWSEGGVMLIYLVNKTDNLMRIDFEKSYVTVNHRELNYYADQNEGARRPYDDPNPSNAVSTYYHELPRVLEIEPQSGQWIEGYPISFDWFPMKNKETHRSFSKERSPLKIKHQLTYTISEAEISGASLAHQIWVTGVRQMKTNEFRSYAQQLEKGSVKEKPELFYIRNPRAGDGQEAEGWAELTIGLLEVITLFL